MSKMRFIIFLFTFLLIPLVSAETSFFDNPNEAFIMSNSATTGGAVGGTSGGTTGGGGCRYEWKCTNWSECLPSGKQTRNCTNIGTCSDTYKSPEINQNCTYTAPKFEEDKKLEKENITEKEEEKSVEISEDESAKENQIEKSNPIFAVILVAIIVLGWIYYFPRRVRQVWSVA